MGHENEKNTITSDSIFKWLVLGNMCLNSMTNIMLSTIMSPIWYQVAAYYYISDYDLNWLSGWYYFGPIIFTFLSDPFVIKYYGITQIISAGASALGLWILVIVKQNESLAMIGFMLLGIGEALYCQTPLYISKIWFDVQERILSTFIGQYANNIGCLIGYIASSYYFFEIYDENEFNYRYQNILLINAILATISLGTSFISLKSPRNDKLQLRETIWGSIKKVCKEKETFLDLLSVSSFVGLSWCYTLLFGTQQYYIGQTTVEIEIISVVFSSGQILAALFCSYKLHQQSKTGLQQNYDFYIRCTIIIGFSFLIIEVLFFESMPFFLLAFSNIFIGAGFGGIYSMLLESLMEKHYPVQELAISSLLVVVACIVSFTIGMMSYIPEFSQYGFQITCFLMIPSFCYISVFYNTQYKRFEFES